MISALKDSGAGTTTWNSISWTATTPANTAIKFQIATSNSAAGPFTFVGPDSSASTDFTLSGASLAQFSGYRYLKYQAFLTSSDGNATPTLGDVTIGYTTTQ